MIIYRVFNAMERDIELRYQRTKCEAFVRDCLATTVDTQIWLHAVSMLFGMLNTTMRVPLVSRYLT